MPFRDRKGAGLKLSKHLEENINVETVVIPHLEAYDVASQVISHFESDTVLKLSHYLSSQNRPPIKIGAVVEDGTIWVDDSLKEDFNVSEEDIRRASEMESRLLRSESSRINGKKVGESAEGNVLIVSDAVGDGFREAAVAGSLKKKGAKNIYLAAPAVAQVRVAELSSLVDDIFYLEKPVFFNSSEDCYRDNNIMKKIQS